MALTRYLDKGALLGRERPCLTSGDQTLSYGDVVDLSHRVARALQGSGVAPGDKVGILSANDPTAFACVFGIARRGAVWCPINPRNEATENRDLLALFECRALIYQRSFAPLVDKIRGDLPDLTLLVCLDDELEGVPSLENWLGGAPDSDDAEQPPPGEIVALVGTGGTTGKPKGVTLTDRNIETMSAIVLMSYPRGDRPVYLALAPLTHAAGVLCFPLLTLGGHIVVMAKPDLGDFLTLVARHRVTHTYMPPTLIYMLLDKEELASADLSSLECFWYGAAPMSPTRLEQALEKIGPMAQLFGQSEAPMMISTMSTADHYGPDGAIARDRLTSAGRPSPLVDVAIMAQDGTLVGTGERGEIVVRGSLVMPGYHRNPEATAEVSAHGWHHTGDIGYLDEDNFLYIVDRAKDMIITGGFNVYSAEVEAALMEHPAVRDCAVVGRPDEKWGERVVAVVEAGDDRPEPAELIAFAKERIGSVKAPKDIVFWTTLPRSTVGKVVKSEVRDGLD
jgi:fatty-acyl-CoA synthase